MHREVMLREGFDYQVVIADNRPLIYEVERDLGVAMARAYNDTVARDIDGKAYFIGIAWVYLPDVDEAIRELRRAVNDLGFRGVKLMGGHANCDLDAEVLVQLSNDQNALCWSTPFSAASKNVGTQFKAKY